MTQRYLVVGNPIKHSKSPQIHSAFAKATGIPMSYEAQAVELDNFERFVTAFFNEGGSGMNVTLPFKERAFALADDCTDHAKAAGAANTLFLKDGKLIADNTDGRGMVSDILGRHQWTLQDKRILVLGAGGAVRGVLEPLKACSPASITISNRTHAKAALLAAEFGVDAVAIEDLNTSYDIVISGSSAGLGSAKIEFPAGILHSQSCVYDMVYGSEPTPLMNWALLHGAKQVADGLGMLVNQAAESFCQWHGVMPRTEDAYNSLR